MGAISSLDVLLARATAPSGQGPPQLLHFWKADKYVAGGYSGSGNRQFSLWPAFGVGWPAGDIPPTTHGPADRTTLGGITFSPPSGGRVLRCIGGAIAQVRQGSLTIYDRLLHGSGLNANITTVQPVGGTLNRYDTAAECVGNEIFAEIYDTLGGNGVSATITYVNQSGNTAVAPALPLGGTSFRETGLMFPVPLAPGDTGVLSITSVQFALPGTGAVGNFGFTIGRRLIEMSTFASVSMQRDAIFSTKPVLIHSNACLAGMWNGAFGHMETLGQISLIEV